MKIKIAFGGGAHIGALEAYLSGFDDVFTATRGTMQKMQVDRIAFTALVGVLPAAV